MLKFADAGMSQDCFGSCPGILNVCMTMDMLKHGFHLVVTVVSVTQHDLHNNCITMTKLLYSHATAVCRKQYGTSEAPIIDGSISFLSFCY